MVNYKISLPAEMVAPYVGAWIEIRKPLSYSLLLEVAPYVGAWIEILNLTKLSDLEGVAPYVGAWIEICMR